MERVHTSKLVLFVISTVIVVSSVTGCMRFRSPQPPEDYQESEWLMVKESGDFALVAVPDTQTLARYHPELITTITQWIKENKVEENIQYVLALGDIVDDGGSVKQWENAKSSYALLEGVLPVSHVLGNHEYDNLTDLRSTRNFNTYFPYPDDMPTLGGVYEDGIADNSFHRFTVDGINYMILALEFFPRDAVLEWACQVVEQYPEDNVIVTTHAFLDGDGAYLTRAHGAGKFLFLGTDFNSAQEMWDKLLGQYENIFLVLCGHARSSNCDVLRKTRIGKHGNTVYQFMINAQWLDADLAMTADKGGGLIMIMRFTNNGQTINFNFYSPVHDLSYRKENQFTINLPPNQLIYTH
jgi:hypothetical protein